MLSASGQHNQLDPISPFISHRAEALGKPGQRGVGQQACQLRYSQAEKSSPFCIEHSDRHCFPTISFHFINNSSVRKVQNRKEVIYSRSTQSSVNVKVVNDAVTSIEGSHGKLKLSPL